MTVHLSMQIVMWSPSNLEPTRLGYWQTSDDEEDTDSRGGESGFMTNPCELRGGRLRILLRLPTAF